MGYYDGIGGNSTAASTYEVAKITDTPVILVVDGKGSSLSLAAQIKGFLDYQKDSHICGVILNKTNKMVGERLRPEIEKLGVRYLGAVPVCETMDIKSRHLGLTMPQEQSELRGHLNAFAKQLEEYLDVDGILELAGCSGEKLPEAGKTEQSNQTDLNQEETKQEDVYKRQVVICCFFIVPYLPVRTYNRSAPLPPHRLPESEPRPHTSGDWLSGYPPVLSGEGHRRW